MLTAERHTCWFCHSFNITFRISSSFNFMKEAEFLLCYRLWFARKERFKIFFRIFAFFSRGSAKFKELTFERSQKWIAVWKSTDLSKIKLKYAKICDKHFITSKLIFDGVVPTTWQLTPTVVNKYKQNCCCWSCFHFALNFHIGYCPSKKLLKFNMIFVSMWSINTSFWVTKSSHDDCAK